MGELMKVLNDIARASGRRIKYLRSPKLYMKLIFASMAIAAGFITGMKATSIDVFAQSDDKNISIFPSRDFLEPQIKIKEVRVGETVRKIREVREGQALKTFGENFKEDSDWLSRTSFQIENVSGKPIVYLKINVLFPETRAFGPMFSYGVIFGRRPGFELQNADPLLFMPNETMDVSLATEYTRMSNFVGQRHSIQSINRIDLEVAFIVFEDGLAWSVGTFMRQDPNNPDHYILVEVSPPEDKP